jgi:hypothetical protein
VKVGVVAEGPSDVAVLLNILFGTLGVERKDVVPIRPELTTDETDLAERRKGGYQPPSKQQFSNWLLVLEECRERTRLLDFLDSPIDEPRFLVVQIDTAEAELPGFDVPRPDHDSRVYVEELRARVVSKLTSLLGADLARQSRFAVAVEEIDAWLLTLHAPGDVDTGLQRNPKKKLEFIVASSASSAAKSRGSSPPKASKRGDRPAKRSPFETYHEQSLAFRDERTLSAGARRNRSLQMFVDSLEESRRVTTSPSSIVDP